LFVVDASQPASAHDQHSRHHQRLVTLIIRTRSHDPLSAPHSDNTRKSVTIITNMTFGIVGNLFGLASPRVPSSSRTRRPVQKQRTRHPQQL
jgi:hypothetical protein